ncbi:MAG: hypothetical protein K6E50_07920 [Lachnospiraceae bacterium]|nr:hypothetical protein [Lachnospiraceae bacterium]
MEKIIELWNGKKRWIKLGILAVFLLILLISAIGLMPKILSMRQYFMDDEQILSVSFIMMLCNTFWIMICKFLSAEGEDEEGMERVLSIIIHLLGSGLIIFHVICYDVGILDENRFFLAFVRAADRLSGWMVMIKESSILLWILILLMLFLSLLPFFMREIFYFLICIGYMILEFSALNTNLAAMLYFIILTIVVEIIGMFLVDTRIKEKLEELSLRVEDYDESDEERSGKGMMIALAIAAGAVLILLIIGKIPSWSEVMGSFLSNDFLETLETASGVSSGMSLISFLMTMFLSALFGKILAAVITKVSGGGGESPITNLFSSLCQIIFSVLLLDLCVDAFMKIYTMEYMESAKALLADPLVALVDFGDNVSSGVLQMIVVILLFLLAMIIPAALLFVAIAGWMVITEAMTSGLVFLFIVLFFDGLFAINYNSLNGIVLFLFCYVANFLSSLFSDEIYKSPLQAMARGEDVIGAFIAKLINPLKKLFRREKQ